MARVCFLMLLIGILGRPAAAQEAPRSPEPDGRALFDEPGRITSAFDFAGRYMSRGGDEPGKDGFYPKVGGMISGAGWISAGPGYRRGLFGDRAIADVYGTVSW